MKLTGVGGKGEGLVNIRVISSMEKNKENEVAVCYGRGVANLKQND